MATSTRDLMTGVATKLAAAGAGTYRSDGSAYLASETAIVFGESPATPDRVVMLTCVPMTDAAMEPTGLWMVQFYFRGKPGDRLDVEDLGDSVFDVMQGATNLTMGSVSVVQCLRQGSVPNGQDPSKRWTRIDRYMFDLEVAPTTNRPTGGWD